MHLRHVMLHCFKKGNSAKDTVSKICIVYGSDTIIIQTVRSWFGRFFRVKIIMLTNVQLNNL